MKLSNVRTIFFKEIKDMLRDRRTLVSMVVVPILLFPVLILGIGSMAFKLVKDVQKEKAKIVVLQAGNDPELYQVISKVERFQMVDAADRYRELISDKEIRAAIEIPKDFRSLLESGQQPVIPIYYYESEIKSETAVKDLEKALSDYRKELVRKQLATASLEEKVLEPFKTRQQNVAAEEKVSGARFGGFLPYIIILMSLTGAMYPAIDLTAGEKERGTIETILVSSASRLEIVLGKFLTVLTASASTVVLSLTSLSLTFLYGAAQLSSLGEAPGNVPILFKITPFSVVMSLLMILPIAILFSAALLTIALFARSYKEAQSYISPLMILVILPAVASTLPGIELNMSMALVPILSTSLATKEILSNVFHWDYLLVVLGSSLLYAAIALGLAIEMFRRESVLFRT